MRVGGANGRMKVIEIRDEFGVDSLQLVERPDRVPGPGQVVLKMKAFSINYRDLLVVNGVGRWKPRLGRVPLSDGVGIVAAAGNGVSRVRVGDRVAPIFYPNWLDGRVAAGKMGQALGGAATDGVLAEYTLFDEASLVHVPTHLTDEEGATLPCAGVTAWNAVVSGGRLVKIFYRQVDEDFGTHDCSVQLAWNRFDSLTSASRSRKVRIDINSKACFSRLLTAFRSDASRRCLLRKAAQPRRRP